MYSVSLTAEARRFFERANQTLQRNLDRCFDLLRQTPQKHPNIKRLKGQLKGFLRFRIGDWRVVYSIDEPAKSVTIVTIAHRREVYD